MNYNNILSETEGAICTITINRPDKMNALNAETVRELGIAVEEAIGNADVRGIIITGSGPKAFVAGADIAEFKGLSANGAENMAQAGHNVFNTIEHSPKPVIAAVNGFALGGGCELAMACHIRIASGNAKFGQPEINLGLIPGYGGTQRLVRLIGKGKATELLLTGDMINAEEAKTLGLVNYVTEPEALLEKAKEILNKATQKSPLVVKQLLKLVGSYYDKKEDGFAAEISEFSKCFTTEDCKEGVGAFLEKRKAEFRGK
jgi:enoyl-CoA hydratase